MHHRRWSFLCLLLLTCLCLTPVLAAEPPPDEQIVRQLEESLTQLESSLAAEPPAADEIRRSLGELRHLSSVGAVPVDDLLTRLEGQLDRLAHGAESADRVPELRRRVEPTVSALRAKLADAGETGQPGTATNPEGLDAPPDNDACDSATVVTNEIVFGDTTAATNDGSASCGGSGSSPDVWYSYTATADGMVTFDTDRSLLDTVLSLHSSCPDSGGAHELTCNDDHGGDFDALVGRQMTSGETVLVRVSGAGGATGEFQLTVDDTVGGLSGTVTKDSTGAPLAGVEIRVTNADGWWQASTTTGADGTYLVPGLGDRNHLVEAYDSGFIREFWDDVQCFNHCFIQDYGTPIPVAENLVDGIDFALSPGGTVTGVITDERTGEPLDSFYPSSARALAYDLSGILLRSDLTDDEGRYVLGGLPEQVKLTASATSYRSEMWDDIPCGLRCDPVSGTTVEVGQGSSSDGYDFGLTRLGVISGTVTETASGSPVSFATVSVRASESQDEWSQSTDSQGEYRIEGLPAGDYFAYTNSYQHVNEVYDDIPCTPACRVTSGTPIPVSLDSTTAGIDFVLNSPGSISGTLTTDDGGIWEGAIDFHDSEGLWVNQQWVYGSDTDWTQPNLYPGTYYVHAKPYWNPKYEAEVYDDLGCAPDCAVTQGTPIQVGSGTSVVGIAFSIAACAADSYQDLVNLNVWGSATYEACREIRVGDGVTVGRGGHLDLTAGRKVSFANGFSVAAGGSLAVTIDPDVASD